MSINVTSKLLEEKVYRFFGIRTWYGGRLVDEYLKLIHPVKYVFFSLDDKNKDFLNIIDEKLLLEIINKR